MSDGPKAETIAIVVLGSMNPSIHHAAWYRRVGLLNDQEEKEAIEGKGAVLLPFPGPLARFGDRLVSDTLPAGALADHDDEPRLR